jgi:hypothetical protein
MGFESHTCIGEALPAASTIRKSRLEASISAKKATSMPMCSRIARRIVCNASGVEAVAEEGMASCDNKSDERGIRKRGNEP